MIFLTFAAAIAVVIVALAAVRASPRAHWF